MHRRLAPLITQRRWPLIVLFALLSALAAFYGADAPGSLVLAASRT